MTEEKNVNPYEVTWIHPEQQTEGIMHQAGKTAFIVGTIVSVPWLIGAGYIAVNKEEYIAPAAIALAGIIHASIAATIPMCIALRKVIQLQVNEIRTEMKILGDALEKKT